MGAEIVLLPELWSSGFDLEHTQQYASPINEGWFAKMHEFGCQKQDRCGWILD